MWGYCTDREDYRLFKLNRMLELKALDERFEERKVPAYDMSPDKAFPPLISVTAVCEADMKWRLIEESGLESFQEREDGKLIFSSCFSDPGSVFSWLLSMGDRVELVEPEELRVEFAAMAEKICRIYR